jgi:hypothetical protein
MTWQRVAALGLVVGGAVAAAFQNDVIAATLAVAAAGFAVNRDPDRNGTAAAAASDPPRSLAEEDSRFVECAGPPPSRWRGSTTAACLLTSS